MSGHHYAVEGRSFIEVTHLALLGVKIAGPAFWGYFYKRTRIKTQKIAAVCYKRIQGTREKCMEVQKIYHKRYIMKGVLQKSSR